MIYWYLLICFYFIDYCCYFCALSLNRFCTVFVVSCFRKTEYELEELKKSNLRTRTENADELKIIQQKVSAVLLHHLIITMKNYDNFVNNKSDRVIAEYETCW